MMEKRKVIRFMSIAVERSESLRKRNINIIYECKHVSASLGRKQGFQELRRAERAEFVAYHRQDLSHRWLWIRLM